MVGSLASGNFGPDSDVDFLIDTCPNPLKYRIEASIEDLMADIPFDLVYRDEAKPHVLKRMEEHQIHDPRLLVVLT